MGAEVVSEEFLGSAMCEWASAPPASALVAKSQGSAGQLAGRESPVNGRFNHGPGGDGEAQAEPDCYKSFADSDIPSGTHS